MEASPRTGTLAVLLVAISMMLVPMTALATHNSVGTHVGIAQADEVDTETGQLQPDVPLGHAYERTFHNNLDTPRVQPADQSGDRYTDCDTFEESKNGNDPNPNGTEDPGYNPADDSTDCYIGFFDSQWEYVMQWSSFATGLAQAETGIPTYGTSQLDNDILYPANPDDSYCDGSDSTGDRGFDAPDQAPDGAEESAEDTVNSPILGGGSAADETLTQAFRSDDSQCAGNGHRTHWFGRVQIDQDLLETAFMGSDADGGDDPGVTDVVGTEEGSGTQTLPFMANSYIFIFGQPHPDAESSQFTAGSGPFGGPVIGIGDACGDRTQDCHLLTPEDIIEYDTHAPNVQGVGDTPRVCGYAPQFSVLNPDPTPGLCGVFGTTAVTDTFLPRTAGGLGATDAPTWVTPQPGWYGPFDFILASNAQLFVDEETTPVPLTRPCQSDVEHATLCGDYFTDEKHMDKGTFAAYAVNPRVPTPDHPLSCIHPNILGGEAGDTLETQLRGYTADAIDVDFYTHPLIGPMLTARDATHDPVREVTRPVEPLLDATTPAEIIQGDPEGVVADAVAEEFPGLAEPIQRADYTEDGDEEPANNVSQNDQQIGNEDGKITFPEGLGCTSTLVLKNREGRTLNTSVRLTVDVDPQQGGLDVSPGGIPLTSIPAIELKDPTLLDGALPASEEDTEQGPWLSDLYSFSGDVQGVIDTNENGTYDKCVRNTGSAQPARDACPWRPIFDAYNSECVGGEGTACEALLDTLQYDINGTDEGEAGGVGMYFVLTVTGPVATVDANLFTPSTPPREAEVQERTRLIGTQDLAGRNCIVGTSAGFQDHLPGHFGDVNSDGVEDMDDILQAVCEDADTQTWIEDAFDDQSGQVDETKSDFGTFDTAVQFAKVLPTPNAVREDAGTGFGDGDQICVHGIWSVEDELGSTPTNDTATSVMLHGDTDPWEFQDCDSFETST